MNPLSQSTSFDTVTRIPDIDWFHILAELNRHDYSCQRIAKEIDVPRSRVRDWYYGSRPKYEDGSSLLILWRKVIIVEKSN